MTGFVEILYQYLPGLATASGRWSLATWAMVCLLFYVYHRTRVAGLKTCKAHLDEEIHHSDAELSKTQRENACIRDENRLLRSILAQPSAKQCANAILRRFVPQADRGFAAVFHWVGDDQRLAFSRGLNDRSMDSLVIPKVVIKRLAANPMLSLEDNSLYSSGLLDLLSPQDRGKVRQLSVVAHQFDGEPVCVLITTGLFPVNAEAGHQQQLARGLMQLIALRLEAERNTEIQTNQLRLTTDMLQLRKVADKISDSPETMIGNYMSCLAHLLHADRIALFPCNGMIERETNVIRCGEELSAGVASLWMRYEEQLVAGDLDRTALQSLSHAELLRQGVDSLIGSAMVIPLTKDGRTIANICCTRRRTEAFAAPERDLATWAAEDFTNAMYRLLSHLSVSREARIDGLTELANRREFDERIQQEWERARETNSACSLLMFDLDRFKLVNDTFGHQAGDYILQETSRQFQIHVMKCRHEDEVLIARYGGEELVILLPGISETGALRIGETIREGIAATDFRFRGLTINVTVSAGIATFPDHAVSVANLIAAADSALYSAKQSGRNRVVCASELPHLVAVSTEDSFSPAVRNITASTPRD